MQRWKSLTIFLASCLTVMLLGGLVTRPALAVWYAQLAKPAWTPPHWLFRPHYQALGRLVARAGELLPTLLQDYGMTFMDGLKVKATPRKHADVLYHLLGYLKKVLNADDKAEIVAHIEAYRQELVPLVVPLTLLKHYFRLHPQPWVLEQTYLQPYPAELMLQNHV